MDVRTINNPSYETMSLLLHNSFAERVENGLNFSCAYYSADDLKNRLSKNAIVIGAFNDNAYLIGMLVINNIVCRYGIKLATHEYLAVAPSAKRMGVGSALFKKCVRECKKKQIDILLSDTAKEAESSVKYHIKQGFRIFGESHYSGRTYRSINFIYPISLLGHILCLKPIMFFLRKKLTIEQ